MQTDKPYYVYQCSLMIDKLDHEIHHQVRPNNKLVKPRCMRRIHFDSMASHEQNQLDLQRELLRIQLNNAIKYNFDFVKELPRPFLNCNI